MAILNYMEVGLLSESSLILRNLPESPITAAAKLRACLPELDDVVPCYETVGLYFSGKPPGEHSILKALASTVPTEPSKNHLIPVCYSLGDDLARAADRLEMGVDDLIEHHFTQTYRCAAVGFVPGFAYLGELRSEISTLKRLETPRVRVDAGSVAIAGKQTAVYPSVSPGGWWILGKTPLQLVDEESGYFPISAGDTVRFTPIDEETYLARKGERL